jgi:hypothetical protein
VIRFAFGEGSFQLPEPIAMLAAIGGQGGKRTFAGTRGNGEDAPIPAVRGTATEPLESTQSGPTAGAARTCAWRRRQVIPSLLLGELIDLAVDRDGAAVRLGDDVVVIPSSDGDSLRLRDEGGRASSAALGVDAIHQPPSAAAQTCRGSGAKILPRSSSLVD